jgi:hypothetical protein
MGTISLQSPQIGQPDTTEDVKIQNNFTTLQTVINGNLDSANLSAATSQSAGVNASGQTVKGAVNIATSQSTGSTTYTTLATPDQITGLVLPTNGLLVMWYRAIFASSVNSAGSATVFVNSNQLVVDEGGSGPPVVQSAVTANANVNNGLYSTAEGLASTNSPFNYGSDATTGQIVGGGSSGQGGPIYIFAAAGTYTVSVQFKASSGTVTALSRKLWVSALSFA